MSADSLIIDARILADVVESIDEWASGAEVDALDGALDAWAVIEDANRQLAVARGLLAAKLAEAMDDKRVTVDGVGVFERHRKTDRKKWDAEALLRDVLDTKLVDGETGEVTDETPLEKVLEVWNLGAPRITALRARGLDPDEYAEVERGGLTIQKVG